MKLQAFVIVAFTSAVANGSILSPLPVSRAPFERSADVARRHVSLATWPFHPNAGWTLLGEERLTTWAEFRSGDKSVVANGYNGLIHIVGQTGFGKLLFYRGGCETTSPADRQRSDPYGRELLAWMEIRVLDKTRPYNRYMESYSNATIKVDAKASSVEWARPCMVKDVKDAVARYSLAPAGDGMLALDYGFDGAFDGKPHPPVEFRLYLCGNSTNGVNGVENGTRLYVNRNSETERVEIAFPDGEVVPGSVDVSPADKNNPVPQYIWRTNAASGRIMIDLCGSTAAKDGAMWASRPAGVIDFYETDALDVPRDPTGNLLVNGSFEQGLLGWNFYWGGMPWSLVASAGEPLEKITDEAKVGKRALRLRSVPGRGYEMLQSMPMSIEPGVPHVLSAWVKRAAGEKGVSRLSIHADFISKFAVVTNLNGGKAEILATLSDDKWHFFETKFVSECGDVKLLLTGGGAAVVVDGVRVERKELESKVGVGERNNSILELQLETRTLKETGNIVEGRLETAGAENIVRHGTPINARLVLSGPDGAAGSVRVTVRNFYDETVFEKTLKFSLPKDNVIPLDFDSGRLGTGVFVLGTEYAAGGTSWRGTYQRFAILKPLDGTHATAEFFLQLGWYEKSSNAEKFARYARDLGVMATNWRANSRFADTNAPETQLRKKYGFVSRLHTLSTELNLKYPKRFGYLKPEGLQSFTNAVPEKIDFIEREAYEAGMKAAPDDIYWSLWNEEDAELAPIRYAKTPEARRAACEVWFQYQYACWKGLKKAFDERGLKLMYAPTHGCGNYNTDWVGRDTMECYMDIAKARGFRYDFIAIHTYGSIDGSFVGRFDRDENAAQLLSRMAHYGYPETTPVMFSEGFNVLPFTIPRWGALAFADSYPNGWTASLDLGWREFLQAGAMARLYIMDLKYWPRVMNSHSWQNRLVADAQMSPIMWNMVPNTLGHLLPSPKFVGDVKRDGWRAYVFRQGRYGVAAVWTNERQVELGRKKGRVLNLSLPEDVRFVDLMGNRRSAPFASHLRQSSSSEFKFENGRTNTALRLKTPTQNSNSNSGLQLLPVPLTPAPLFIVSRGAEGLLKAFCDIGR